MTARRAAVLGLAIALAAVGCDDMSDQAKVEPYEATDLPRRPPDGTVARGDLEREAILARRPAMSMALLERGRERYRIYCSPCHGLSGHGDGMIVKRGFPAPPDFHQPRLGPIAPERVVQVITNGYGVMYSHADRVAPRDRWAIAAYLQALRVSQNTSAEDLSADDRGHLAEIGAGAQ